VHKTIHARFRPQLPARLPRYLENEQEADAERATIQEVEHQQEQLDQSITVQDFYAYMPAHRYLFVPSRELWPAASVNARVTRVDPRQSISAWLDEYRPVDQMTWAPGEPILVRDRLVVGGGWIHRPGCQCFNLYLPPRSLLGDPLAATRWLDHIRRVFPESVDHIVNWLAHRVQRPGEKINHALVLGGAQGIGKDSLLDPLRYAIGPWNFVEVSPLQLLGRFNGFVKSVILRVSEARDLGDVNRYAFYEHMKVYTAAPPEVLRCDEKHLREHPVLNVCGVIITTNHKAAGIYLPADDRRHYVAWSDLTIKDFTNDYWNELYAWYRNGGVGHVAAYLQSVDLSGFDAKAPPVKTAAFWDIVDANRAPEDAELADALEALNRPAVTLTDIVTFAVTDDFRQWLQDRRNRRLIPHRMESAGYVPVRNDADKRDGQWKVAGKRQTVYARRELTVRDRLAAATALCRGR
jgi:hypothetical protein